MAASRPRALYLCTHNSARSQMAEGYTRERYGDRFEAHSAGTEATAVRPLAIRVMREIGIEIGHQESKALDRYLTQTWDFVITVCDQAHAACPFFSGGKRRLHWSLPDPSAASGSEEEQLRAYRAVRDDLRRLIDALAAEAGPETSAA